MFWLWTGKFAQLRNQTLVLHYCKHGCETSIMWSPALMIGSIQGFLKVMRCQASKEKQSCLFFFLPPAIHSALNTWSSDKCLVLKGVDGCCISEILAVKKQKTVSEDISQRVWKYCWDEYMVSPLVLWPFRPLSQWSNCPPLDLVSWILLTYSSQQFESYLVCLINLLWWCWLATRGRLSQQKLKCIVQARRQGCLHYSPRVIHSCF